MRWLALYLPAALSILLGCGRPVVYPMQVGGTDERGRFPVLEQTYCLNS